MTNKEVEMFVRDKYALKDCDQVHVEFKCIMQTPGVKGYGCTEIYKVICCFNKCSSRKIEVLIRYTQTEVIINSTVKSDVV